MREIAQSLEEKTAIPAVRQPLSLIQEIQTDTFWQRVSVAQLETVRKQLRGLVQFIEKTRQKPVYTSFADERGEAVAIDLTVSRGAQG